MFRLYARDLAIAAPSSKYYVVVCLCMCWVSVRADIYSSMFFFSRNELRSLICLPHGLLALFLAR